MTPRSLGAGRCKVVREGAVYCASLGILALACGLLVGTWAAAPWGLAALFCLYFFRDPDRVVPSGAACVAPADGTVVRLRPEPDGRVRVGIFLNVFDVHVNRSPVAGRVRSTRYAKGRFRLAHLDAASAENERNTLVIEDEASGAAIEVQQIAGLIARRIVCWKKEGDHVSKGERFGLIRFGSRVDLLLPGEWRVAVRQGDRVRGGASVLAERAGGGAR